MNVKLGLARPLLTFWQFLTCSATLYGFCLWINLFILGARIFIRQKVCISFRSKFLSFFETTALDFDFISLFRCGSERLTFYLLLVLYLP